MIQRWIQGVYKTRSLSVSLAVAVVLGLLSACTPATSSPTAAPYSVDIRPDEFVTGVDNAYFPLAPGAKYVYESRTSEGLEQATVEVLPETRQVMGVPATVVHDSVTLDGELIEDTYDWYAQDIQGNVWYLGEDVTNYENGQVQDKAGSWETGVDGALPGILIFGDPAAHLGETYRQEYYAGVAEDMGNLLSLGESVSVPFGSFTGALKTLDYTPLEPGVKEEKYYIRDVGLVKTVDPDTGEEEVLIQFSPP
jgi:hypothetical protein